MYLDLTYRSIFDQLDEALSKKTLIATNARTRKIGKTAALVHLAGIKEIPIVVMDLMVNSYKKEYPNLRIIGETAIKKSTHFETVLVDEGVQEETITILRDKGVTVSGFFLDRRIHGIEYTPLVKGLGIMIKEEAENFEHQTFEDPPLLQITLKDINSIPEVIHKGESLKKRVNIDFSWESSGPDEFGSTYINLQTADATSKYPVVNRTQYKRGKALNELPTKDDLVWDKERGVYILQKKK
ncbi:hypothetical protein MH111_14070 [Bacillus altitudinis]|uniref:hypothetical protein n=1 Tax=Bacillus altitudinis TaxID=293387 RepID=UPI0022804F5B|nr:hypothetical protein [Bacillus altitudinis]MCY7691579.1 hypothetical protein [Bacillus altitudinis]